MIPLLHYCYHCAIGKRRGFPFVHPVVGGFSPFAPDACKMVEFQSVLHAVLLFQELQAARSRNIEVVRSIHR